MKFPYQAGSHTWVGEGTWCIPGGLPGKAGMSHSWWHIVEDPCKAPQCHPPAVAVLGCQLNPACCLENPWLCHRTKWDIISQPNRQIVKYTMIYQLFLCNNCSHIVSLPLSLFLWFMLFGCPIDISKMRFLSPSLAFLLSPIFLWQFIGLREVFPIMIISSCFVDKRST